jgi:hypothetical protein
VISASAALADVYVLSSTAAAIDPGRRLSSNETIVIPAGSLIRAVLPSGKTQTIKGPFSGPVAALEAGQSHDLGVLAWLRGMLESGGSREVTPGATRGITRAAPRVRLAFSWSAVPALADATVCVEKGSRLQLVRAPQTHAERVGILDIASGARGETEWEGASEVAPWPPELTPRADATFQLLMADRTQRRVSIRVLEQLPTDDDVLAQLHKLGCRFQFEAWVRAKMASSP